MQPTVVGIGELLWDLLPGGRRLGGAPVNFAYHCGQLGARAVPVSRIGRDAAGRAIRRRVAELGLQTAYLQRDPLRPTGTVKVQVGPDGRPSYEICEGVAWDHLRFEERLRRLAARADAVCFGSLAQRSPNSRAAIRKFLELCHPAALRIFDVNLRQHYYSREVIEASLRAANVLKISDEELPVLARLLRLRGSPTAQLRRLRERYGLRLVAYTRGRNGSLLVSAGAVAEHPGYAARVVDTVGAGDAFAAALCMGLLAGWPLPEIGRAANRLAAFVCRRAGATPALPAGWRGRFQRASSL